MTDFTTKEGNALGFEMGERSFVIDAWIQSFKTSAMAKFLSIGGKDAVGSWSPSQEYFDTWSHVVTGLLCRASVRLLFDDVGNLGGFICWEPFESGVCIHYIYIKLMYRRRGLAKMLLSFVPMGEGFVYYTHRSRGVTKVPDSWIFTIRPLLSLLQEAA